MWQSVADIKRALDLVETTTAAAPLPDGRGTTRFGWWWSAGAFVLGAVIAVAGFRLIRPAAVPQWTSRPITYSGHANLPVLSPDGKQIAYFWTGDKTNEAGMYVQLVSGGNPLLLPVNEVRGRFTWSPDGSQIAFTSHAGLQVMPALGGAPRRIAAFPEGMAGNSISWSPGGGFFVLDGLGKGLSVVSAEGGGFKPLTKPAAGSDGAPAISPDGRAVAFVRRTSTFNSAVIVLGLTSDGSSAGSEQTLTTGVWDIGSLDWTADGSGIIFSGSAGSNNPSLWRVARGGTPVRLTMPSMISAEPTIARQSGRMVYASKQYETRILKLTLGGPAIAEPQPLVEAIGEHSDVAVGPRGGRIAFVSNRTGSKEIWMAKADGSNQTQLTFFDGPAVGSPRFSPDGKQIAFDGYAEGSSDIYVVPVDGGKAVRLTTESGNEVRPSWSHDGQWIYYSWYGPGHPRDIWKVRATGGGAVQVARHGNNPLETPDGQWLYISETPNLWRLRPDGTEETLVSPALGTINLWTIGARSVYMLDPGNLNLLRAPFGSTSFESVYRFSDSNRPGGGGKEIGVPNDESYAIYLSPTRDVSTLMLIEGFR